MLHAHLRLRAILALFAIAVSTTFASAQNLNLVPQPRELRRAAGRFMVTGATVITVASRSEEDRFAAGLLADEIKELSGRRPRISRTGKGGIHLARLDSNAALRAQLQREGVLRDSVDEEGYVLRSSTNGIIVAANTAQGVFYGVQTLRQLLRRDGKAVVCPAVSIRDWPAMRWRGVHDDVSRGPIPTLDYMKAQVRTIAEYKLNLFSLYMEYVFDYKSEPLMAPKPGGITADEVRELVEYARRYHVTILPEQQAFGHLHHMLKYDLYAELGETPHGHVLTPTNPATYTFIERIYKELVPLFPGPLFHVGADETWELGKGQTRTLADSQGLGRVYIDHLRKVNAIMQPYGKRLMFWGDIAAKYPELLPTLPKTMIAVPWAYDARPSFAAAIAPFRNAGLDTVVAPGASNWSRIFPNLDTAFVNIRNFVRDGQQAGALGMLNTTWDDDGEALFGMTWPAIVFGAACAWQPGESSIDDVMKKYDWAFYRSDATAFQDAVRQLTSTHGVLSAAKLGDASDEAFWMDPFGEQWAAYVEAARASAKPLRLAAEKAIVLLWPARPTAARNRDTVDALLLAARRLDTLGMKIEFIDEINRFYRTAYENQSNRRVANPNLDEITGDNGRLADLRDAVNEVRRLYERQWMQENRPYWLENVLVRYDALASKFQAKLLEVKAVAAKFRQTGVLPPPEQLGFYVKAVTGTQPSR